MFRLGDIFLGPLEIVTRQPGVFEEWMIKEMTAPIVGSVAGKLKGRPEAESMEFSGVPWTVEREKGVWLIAAAPEASGAKLAMRSSPSIGKIVGHFSLAEIRNALLGLPGDKKEVVLRRAGQSVKLETAVARVL